MIGHGGQPEGTRILFFLLSFPSFHPLCREEPLTPAAMFSVQGASASSSTASSLSLSLNSSSFFSLPRYPLSLSISFSLSYQWKTAMVDPCVLVSKLQTRRSYGFRGGRSRWEELCTKWDGAFGRGGGVRPSRSSPPSYRHLRPP